MNKVRAMVEAPRTPLKSKATTRRPGTRVGVSLSLPKATALYQSLNDSHFGVMGDQYNI